MDSLRTIQQARRDSLPLPIQPSGPMYERLRILSPTLVLFYPSLDSSPRPIDSVDADVARQAMARRAEIAAHALRHGFVFEERHVPLPWIEVPGQLPRSRGPFSGTGLLIVAPAGPIEVRRGLMSDTAIVRWLNEYRARLERFDPPHALIIRTGKRQ